MYRHVRLSQLEHRPWVYTNFVSTIDGRVAVGDRTSEYWPLGSEEDFEAMLQLRAHADLLVHGRKTAMMYRALNRLESPGFQARRRVLGKPDALPYVVVSRCPSDELIPFLASSLVPARLLTLRTSFVSRNLAACSNPLFYGCDNINVCSFLTWCHAQGYRQVLVEGGPSLVRAFLEAGCLDELFLTITPKLLGGETHQVQTLLGGALFSPTGVPQARLHACETLGDEVFLRYLFSSEI